MRPRWGLEAGLSPGLSFCREVSCLAVPHNVSTTSRSRELSQVPQLATPRLSSSALDSGQLCCTSSPSSPCRHRGPS